MLLDREPVERTKLVYGLLGPRPLLDVTPLVVLVEQHEASRLNARPQDLERISVRLKEVNVKMEYRCRTFNGVAYFRDPALNQFHGRGFRL